ncbi:PREDICTED: uncharacterized protein LOC108564729 [Nicrophorus vespilloides]|uniref:Uncharacterized protein LOC108564729 n=1 Tax=Nicrophorus vespilloides TaxID=110193 RepID=A0ABM1MXM6_NICVS|nr:PREDICTED: uncharacterized protein LOC108564729 [Nicrophorus vespilloides]
MKWRRSIFLQNRYPFGLQKERNPVGFRSLHKLVDDSMFRLSILIGNYISYFCVLMDFTKYVNKYSSENKMNMVINGLLIEEIYCFDLLFMIDIVIAYCIQKSGVVIRHRAVMCLDFISLIPIESIYIIYLGQNIKVYYGFRLRYILRCARYIVPYFKLKFKRHTVHKMLFRLIMIISFLMITGACMKITIMCKKYPQELKYMNCSKLDFFDYTLSYYMTFGPVSYAEVMITGTRFGMTTFFGSAYLFLMYVIMELCRWRLICNYIVQISDKYEFVISCDLAQNQVRKLRSRLISELKWTYKDELYLDYLRSCLTTFWKQDHIRTDRSDIRGYAVATMPETIHTEIKLDLTWNMLKHSIFFRNEPVNVLRYLSKFVRYKYRMTGDTIYIRGQFKTCMVYVTTGIIGVLSEENGERNLISLSSGTCLGELSLFYNVPAKTTVICTTYCEILTISNNKFIQFKYTYPAVYEKLRKMSRERIELAKNYVKIRKKFKDNCGWKINDPSLRYIKQILRMNNDVEDMFTIGHERQKHWFKDVAFCPSFLTMYVMADKLGENLTRHFVRTGLFFKINPNSTLLKMWYCLLHVLIMFTCIVCPVGAAMDISDFSQIYDFFMQFVTFVYILDLISIAFIAVVDKDGMHTDFDYIFHLKMHSSQFLVDLISSLPLELAVNILQGPLEKKIYRMLQLNRLLKIQQLVVYFRNRQVFTSWYMLFESLVKMIVSLILLILIGFYVCIYNDIFKFTSVNSIGGYFGFMMALSFIYTFYFSTGLMSISYSRAINFIPLIGLQFVAFIWKLTIIPQVIASFGLNYTTTVGYENLVDDIRKVMYLYEFELNERKKIWKLLHMNYVFQKGLYLIKFESVKKFIGLSLYKRQAAMLYTRYFMKEKLFAHLSEELIKDMNEICKVILMPKEQIVAYAGSFTNEFYIIIRGSVGLFNSSGKLMKTLTIGDSFLLIESLSKAKGVYNIITLTDCKLLYLPTHWMMRKFLKYPNEYATLTNTIKQTLDIKLLGHLQQIEISSNKLPSQEDTTQSFKTFKNQYHIFIMGFGKMSVMSWFFFKFTIYPNGKFWFYWEIFHLVFAYITAFIGFLPLTAYNSFTSPWFFIFRIFDLVAIADIFMQHYVIFYNRIKIEVSHPWRTSINYWSTNFIIDLIASIPYDLILMNSIETVTAVQKIIMFRSNRLIHLYRFLGFYKYCNQTYMTDLKVIIVLNFILTILMLFNILFSTIFFGPCTFDLDNITLTCGDLTLNAWDVYCNYLYKFMKCIFNSGFFDQKIESEMVPNFCLVNVFGLIYVTIFVCIMTGTNLFRNSHLTTFQIRMQRLVNYMNLRRLDKQLRNEIIKHYEHLWLLHEGKSLDSVFQYFNDTIYQDLFFSQYAPILKNTFLFRDVEHGVLKELFSYQELSRDLFLIRGIIIKVNNIQNKMHIILKGHVEVLGPDCTRMQVLGVGSVFGCLDNVKNHRSTLTYVAKTHCELLTIATMKFYAICAKYSDFYNHFRYLVRRSNIDYIKSGDSDKVLEIVTTSKSMITKSKRYLAAFNFLFKVRKRSKSFEIAMVIYCLASFYIECYQKIVFDYSYQMVIICYFLDLITWFKIYKKFLTSFENIYGLQVYKRKTIALRYIRNYTEFLLDFAGVFPFEIISLIFNRGNSFWIIWSYGRVNRLLKIVTVFLFVRSVRNRLHVNVTLVRGVWILLVIVTFQQLTMMIIVRDTMIQETCENSHVCLYFMAIVLQIYIMSSAFIAPFMYSNNNEHLHKLIEYSLSYTFIILVTNVLSIYVFSEGVSSCQVLYFSKFRFDKYISQLSQDLASKNISPPLRRRVVNYFKNLGEGGWNVQFPSFLRDAPYYLREGVLDSMYGFHLRNHPVFRRCHVDLVRQIASTFTTLYFFDGDFIANIGDIDGKMYFIHTGQLLGLSEDTLDYEVVDRHFETGEHFGFEQLFQLNVGHKYSYKVISKCIILVLSSKNVLPLLDFFPASKHMIYDMI